MKTFIQCFLVLLVISSCTGSREGDKQITGETSVIGKWRGTIASGDREIPFIFELTGSGDSLQLYLINGAERLTIDDVSLSQDSLHISFALFDAAIHAKISGGKLTGVYVKNYVADYRLPFTAEINDTMRFRTNGTDSSIDYNGNWEVDFIEEDGVSKALGMFHQDGKYLTGTFATPSGDYRFLEGVVSGDTMKLSTFDGTHLYLFEGKVDESGAIDGGFWSGKSFYQKWIAKRNESFELPDATTLTFLKPGFEKFNISFPDANGNMVSLSDERFVNKPVILQIMGSWCPNCMDESRFLAEWYGVNNSRGVEIIGLAFERKADPAYASERVKVMKEKLGLDYEVLIAGTTAPESRAAALPMLEKVMSFPTTIYLDKQHKVRKIHTGFSGPGTGPLYEKFIEDFTLFMDKLIAE